MGHEGNMIVVRQINKGLQEIARSLDGGKIPAPHSNEAHAILTKVSRWERQATNFARLARSQAGLTQVSHQGKMRGRSSRAYSTRQSYNSRMQNARSLEEACEIAAETCGYILDRLGRAAALELASSGAEMIKKALEGHTHELSHTLQQNGANPPPPPSGGMVAGGTGVILVLAAALALLRMSLEGKKR